MKYLGYIKEEEDDDDYNESHLTERVLRKLTCKHFRRAFGEALQFFNLGRKSSNNSETQMGEEDGEENSCCWCGGWSSWSSAM